MANIGEIKNHFLRQLPPDELGKIAPELQMVNLPLRQTLIEPGTLVPYVYFPQGILASVIMTMVDGTGVEIGMIGPEGLAGMPALFGTGVSAYQVIVQAAGDALRINAKRCREIFTANEIFRDAVLRFFEDFHNLASLSVACNRLHSIERRCARWLLMATDRLQSANIPMTHEFLSAMLGTRRAGVTEVAGEFQRSGLIRYHHGQLRIIDREGLEALACECYAIDHRRLKSSLNK